VRGQIVRIDRLQRLELLHRLIGAVLLVVRDPKLAPCVARLRILRDHLLQIGNLGFGVPLPALDQAR
jgi:hypothetical protein